MAYVFLFLFLFFPLLVTNTRIIDAKKKKTRVSRFVVKKLENVTQRQLILNVHKKDTKRDFLFAFVRKSPFTNDCWV